MNIITTNKWNPLLANELKDNLSKIHLVKSKPITEKVINELTNYLVDNLLNISMDDIPILFKDLDDAFDSCPNASQIRKFWINNSQSIKRRVADKRASMGFKMLHKEDDKNDLQAILERWPKFKPFFTGNLDEIPDQKWVSSFMTGLGFIIDGKVKQGDK